MSAWLVIPKWEGRFGAILFGHWMMKGSPFSNRDEFLGEAVLLARSGAVSLLIEAPEQESIAGPRQVIDFRRGLDLLLARPDVDPERIAYVGHGFNAQVGAILATVEKRIQSFVLMAGAYDADSPVHSSPAALFLQLAGKDQSRQKAKQYFDRFDEPKRIQIYDGGHALNADARRDRVNWLVKRLALRPIDDAALMSIPQLK